MHPLNPLYSSFNSQELFEKYAYLVPQLLRRLSSPHDCYREDELMMHGYLALTEAAARYKERKGLPFERYARMQVQAKILCLEGKALVDSPI